MSVTYTGNAGILPAIIRNNHNLQARCLRSQLEVTALMVRLSGRGDLPTISYIYAGKMPRFPHCLKNLLDKKTISK